jgi:hypothetical protein
MAEALDDLFDEIDGLDAPEKRKLPLPNDELIERYEAVTGILFPKDYQYFLKRVSNAFIGYLYPLILNNEMGGVHGELLTELRQARKAGLPLDWLPICEDNGNYYCLVPNGSIRYWSHDGRSDDSWIDLATWVRQVWMDGN